jgi:hypothetical protein
MAVKSRVPARAADAPRPSRPRRQNLFWSRLHFLIRFLGLTGAMAGCAGFVLAKLNNELVPLDSLASWQDAWTTGADFVRDAFENAEEKWRTVVLLSGAAAALLALVVEVVVVLCFTASRRSAFGLNAVLQGALAAVLLVGVNVWSYHHYVRVDYTRDRQFTLPTDLRDDLRRLDPNSRTTVIVYQRHKTFGTLTDKPPDDYDSAAERKVVEKVKDLIEQLREVGPQLRVEQLDVQEKNYKEQLDELTRDEPELRRAIESAPENSIFFYARGDNGKPLIQRLSFSDFYLLDKKASQEDRGGRGNLVLLYQGMGPFARRILNLDEKKPRIGIATIHEVLTTSGTDEIGLHGLRAALEARGFAVEDVVLKKWGGFAGPQPAAYTVEESVLDRLNSRETLYQGNLANLEKARAEQTKERDFWKKAPDDEKTRTSLLRDIREQAPEMVQDIDQKLRGLEVAIRQYRQSRDAAETEAGKAQVQKTLDLLEGGQRQLTASRDLWKKATDDEKTREQLLRQIIEEKITDFDGDLERLDDAIRDYQQRLAGARAEKAKLNVPAVLELQRMTDLKAKLQRLLADCDLLIVPRLTLRNTASLRENIPPRVYRLDEPQVEAIKDFLKAGKPVLACFGPSNWPEDVRNPDDNRPDALEDLLAQLGVKLGKQTVLFDTEVEGFAENRAGLSVAGAGVEVPPLLWDWKPGEGLPPGSLQVPRPPNRIRESVRLTARGLGKDQALDVRIRHPRPVYYEPPKQTDARQLAAQAVAPLAAPNWAGETAALAALQKARDAGGPAVATDPVFLMTSPRSWNEDDPFPTDTHIPQFEQPKRGKDERKQLKPASMGLETRRRGPFPIGVAFQTQLPGDWYASAADKPATVRLAVIGQGGFFTGKELPAAQEKLIVHTLNWLLGREDYLPREERVWSYPRVDATLPPDSPTEKLWQLGTRLGLPVLFAYFGLVVLLIRRLR